MAKLDTTKQAIRRVLRKALDTVTPSLREIARETGISYAAIRQYRRGQRTPKPGTLRALVGALRKRSARLAALASDLAALEEHGAPKR